MHKHVSKQIHMIFRESYVEWICALYSGLGFTGPYEHSFKNQTFVVISGAYTTTKIVVNTGVYSTFKQNYGHYNLLIICLSHQRYNNKCNVTQSWYACTVYL